jgi:methyltransferase (TIGR00027 family)
VSSKAAQTGPGAMVLVAIEQAFPEDERIIDDDLAKLILPLSFRINVWISTRVRDWLIRKTEEKVPGLWGGIMARKRYIDEIVTKAADGHIEAVVNLGAGFDTRAFRLPALAEVPVWEVDQPQNINAKKVQLEKLLQRVPTHVTLVPIDFDRQDLVAVLTSRGYEPDRTTFFIWEGVTEYITEGGVRATFDFLAKAPAGSRLVFTYIPRDFIDGEVYYGQEYLYRQMLLKDKIWVFGIDPENVDDFLDEYGWRVLEHLGYEELGQRYVKPTGRELESMAVERIVSAEKYGLESARDTGSRVR